MDLPDLKSVSKWYFALIAGGVAITVAAVAKEHNALILTGIGMTLWGVGETINHPEKSWTAVVEGTPGIVSGRFHDPKIHGWIIDAIGVALMCYGILKIAQAT